MAVSIFSVITNPRQFFEKKAGEPESLTLPVLIILLQGILGSISGYVIADLTTKMYPAIGNFGPILGIFSIVGAIIGAFVFWVLITVLFYLISMAFKGEGGFRRTLEFIGYGSIPLIFGALISGIIILLYAPGIQVPVVTAPEDLAKAVTALMKEPVLRLSSLIGIVMTVWSANLWVFGIRVARKLSLKDAALTVGIPTAIYILYSIYSLGFF